METQCTQDYKYDYNDCNSEKFVYLEEFDEHLTEQEELDFVYPFNSKIINFENVGSLLVLSDQEVINVKFTVSSNPYDKVPLKVKKSSKFTRILGQEIISTKLYTYILDKKGDLYKFKSSQSLEKIKHRNVQHLEAYNFVDYDSIFVMIALVNSKVVLYIFDKFFNKEYSGYQRCVDLIVPQDCIPTLENEFTYEKVKEDYKFCSEMLYNIIENDLDVEFFNIFLGLDLKSQNIKDILLVAINDRLNYIKYHGTFEEEYDEMSEDSNCNVSVETVLVTRSRIKCIKYLNSSIMIIDDFWVLTIYYQCMSTNVIKRREIALSGDITCYRFTDKHLIYSNRYKIVFMSFMMAPADPEILEVDLTLVATFSVDQNYKFLIAIDKNKFFYYVPIPKFTNQGDTEDSEEDSFIKISNRDMKQFPEAIKYLGHAEQELKELSENIHHEKDMLVLLTHLEQNENIKAGHATVKYLPFLTPSEENDIICDPITSTSGFSYMRIVIDLESIFCAFKFTIAFYRHTKNRGTIVKHIEINPRNEKKKFAIYVPDEIDDDKDNKLELFANFYLNTPNECHTLQFPFIIDEIMVSSSYRPRKNVEVETCIKALNKLLKDE